MKERERPSQGFEQQQKKRFILFNFYNVLFLLLFLNFYLNAVICHEENARDKNKPNFGINLEINLS